MTVPTSPSTPCHKQQVVATAGLIQLLPRRFGWKFLGKLANMHQFKRQNNSRSCPPNIHFLPE